MANRTIASTLCDLIVAYWTPERIDLWHEYEKTDRSISWREYEHIHRKKNFNSRSKEKTA